jgi:hypothetical protein
MGFIPRRGQKRDGNESEIIDALKAAGASVMQISGLDLIVGYKRKSDGALCNALIEVKMPGKKPDKDQQAYINNWKGAVYVVHTVEQALEIISL